MTITKIEVGMNDYPTIVINGANLHPKITEEGHLTIKNSKDKPIAQFNKHQWKYWAEAE